ncbi:hypothetical protein H7J86_26250 [Mycobacterium hackensackense]|uniref:hypothetical protein n=1 Tax=Mycobacterium hackensackense TaxID=228909 RepID=UPI0022659292|nr:hypothetical protein [Mycobacterium hackensackense]MCV7255671.1 hypothetical protein [Mycobacterium hackensackense]
MSDDILQAITEAAEFASRWEPSHPQYIEGTLYLTQQQWDATVEQFPPEPGCNYAHALWGIPVAVIHPDNPITLPSGKQLYLSGILGALLIHDPDAALLPPRTPGEALRDLLDIPAERATTDEAAHITAGQGSDDPGLTAESPASQGSDLR